MKNTIILGSGRSGTSLTAGMLSKSYYKGQNMVESWDANPRGFFEDKRINALNEQLLAQFTANQFERRNLRNGIYQNLQLKDGFKFGQRWLANIEGHQELNFRVSRSQLKTMQQLLSEEPYCLKDPRFSYTLGAWQPVLSNIGFICVFREPSKTVSSIEKFIEGQRHSLGFQITPDFFLDMWCNQYEYIIEHLSSTGNWLFVHYDQIISKEKIHEIESFLETTIDDSFIDPTLKRSKSSQEPDNLRAQNLYGQLCNLANFNQNSPK